MAISRFFFDPKWFTKIAIPIRRIIARVIAWYNKKSYKYSTTVVGYERGITVGLVGAEIVSLIVSFNITNFILFDIYYFLQILLIF